MFPKVSQLFYMQRSGWAWKKYCSYDRLLTLCAHHHKLSGRVAARHYMETFSEQNWPVAVTDVKDILGKVVGMAITFLSCVVNKGPPVEHVPVLRPKLDVNSPVSQARAVGDACQVDLTVCLFSTCVA